MPGHCQVIDRKCGTDIFPKRFSNQIYFSSDAEIYFEYKSVYSLKLTLSGTDKYQFNNSFFQVTSRKYLIVNNDNWVVCHPSASERALSVFFEPELIKEVFSALRSSQEGLLLNPLGEGGEEPHFFEYIYPIDNNQISKSLLFLAARFETPAPNDLEFGISTFYQLAEALILSQQQTFQNLRRTKAAKASTQLELHKRMLQARNLMHDCWNKPASLQSLSRQVYMSPYHFHRTFKSTFGVPPMKYQTTLRLEKARSLLQSKNHSISEIAMMVGYEDIFSFSKAFKKKFSVPPSGVARGSEELHKHNYLCKRHPK